MSIPVGLLLLTGTHAHAAADGNSTVSSAPATSAYKTVIDYEDRLTRSLYAGIGLGISRLEPDTSNAPDWDPNDRINEGGQINLGIDLLKQLSVELHSADLGSAGLSPAGRINYHISGISMLAYAGKARHRFLRRGMTAYGRLGLGTLNNSPVGDVPFEKINASHLLFGAGIEYMHRSGFGTRAEVISFDKDALYGQLGLIYRLGKRPTIERLVEVTPAPVVEPIIAAAKTPEPVKLVTADPCKKINGVLDAVNFRTDSAQLTDTAHKVLDEVAVTLANCASVPVIISAHTDNMGTHEYNQSLSERRAESVLHYLSIQGIPRAQLSSMAFGETDPKDSNQTPQGRRNNRRVEVIAH